MGYEPVFSYINWEEKKELVESGDIDCVWGSFTIDGYRICVIIPEENTRRPAMSTSTSDIMVKMIQFSNGNRHDINHFMKVYTYAKTIAESENVSEKDLITVETAAIVHVIAFSTPRSTSLMQQPSLRKHQWEIPGKRRHSVSGRVSKRHRSAGRNQETGCFSGGTSSHLNRY